MPGDHGFCSAPSGLAPPVATPLCPYRGSAHVPPKLSRAQTPVAIRIPPKIGPLVRRRAAARLWISASPFACRQVLAYWAFHRHVRCDREAVSVL
jgi:hypothetical protein